MNFPFIKSLSKSGKKKNLNKGHWIGIITTSGKIVIMPTPKPFRRFARQRWLSIRKQLGIDGHIQITASPKGHVSRLGKEVDPSIALAYVRMQAAAETLSKKGEPLVYVDPEKITKMHPSFKSKGQVRVPPEQVISHELAEVAYRLACRKRGVELDETIQEFVAHWGELEFAREKNRPFFSGIINGKIQYDGPPLPMYRTAFALATELFRRHPRKAERLKVIRFVMGKGANELRPEQLKALVEQGK